MYDNSSNIISDLLMKNWWERFKDTIGKLQSKDLDTCPNPMLSLVNDCHRE